MPLIGLLFGLYYPLVVLSGQDNLWYVPGSAQGPLDTQRDYAWPLQMALLAWIALYATYLLTLRLPLPGVRRIGQIGGHIAVRTLTPWAFCFLFGSIGFEITYRMLDAPFMLKSAVHFGFALGHLGVMLLAALSVQRRLSLLQNLTFYLGFIASIFLQLGSSATWKVTYVLFAYFLGRWIVRRHFGVATLLAGLAAILFFVMVRGAMTQWRQIRWCSPEVRQCMPESEVPGSTRSIAAGSELMLAILARQVEDSGFVGAARHGWSVVAHRATLDLLADAMRRTPSEIPYWNGFTYHSLVGFAIPRFLWPDKPQKTLGQDFGHRYAYLGPEDMSTSINLPFLVEFYINFGEPGMIWGMCLVGGLFAVLERYVNQPRQSLLVTLAGGVLLFPLLTIENDFSLQFGGLFLYAVALWVVVWTIELLQPGRRRSCRQPALSAVDGRRDTRPARLPVVLGEPGLIRSGWRS